MLLILSLVYLAHILRIIKFYFMNRLLFLGSIGATEIIIIALIVVLLFGGKKIPELMKGIGKGVKSFKDGVKGVEDEINSSDNDKDKEKK
ncbi:Sec-independent protein translocase protein TatA [bioreactor metagenome]|uniref:Sec-independent protein translocase protein TatA n=1 Tax=bioreactor metagenome TaxID=1076179 RepID=A0A644V1K9_9ZZZZ